MTNNFKNSKNSKNSKKQRGGFTSNAPLMQATKCGGSQMQYIACVQNNIKATAAAQTKANNALTGGARAPGPSEYVVSTIAQPNGPVAGGSDLQKIHLGAVKNLNETIMQGKNDSVIKNMPIGKIKNPFTGGKRRKTKRRIKRKTKRRTRCRRKHRRKRKSRNKRKHKKRSH